ncbi:MAG: hypothetical protein JRF30_00490 [Deltaproteobacteria bacterium]|nr:hypothetical protein [Deltaproteobacteria bacterium]MBW1794503.1 hypothetical protein [Deltaproteobacteria bacterium]MBW2329430.1 hypothetical protein [Deltaproteobacteria bacterium]
MKLNQLERRIENHDESIEAVFEAIRELMTPPEKSRRIYPVKSGFPECVAKDNMTKIAA